MENSFESVKRTPEKRQYLLENEIAKYINKGYVVTVKDGFSAQLMRKKKLGN